MNYYNVGDLVLVKPTRDGDLDLLIDLVGKILEVDKECRTGMVYKVEFQPDINLPEETTTELIEMDYWNWFYPDEVELAFTV